MEKPRPFYCLIRSVRVERIGLNLTKAEISAK
jgi:hypothetical protein